MLKRQLHCDVSRLAKAHRSFCPFLYLLVKAGHFSQWRVQCRSLQPTVLPARVTCPWHGRDCEHVCMAQESVCQCVSLIKRSLSILDTCPGTWLDWDKLIPAITTPAAVSSGEQELTQIRHRRWRDRKERAKKEVAQLAYELYIYIYKKYWENDRGKTGMGRSCSVTLHVSEFFFFSLFPVSWHRLLGSQSLSQTLSVLK